MIIPKYNRDNYNYAMMGANLAKAPVLMQIAREAAQSEFRHLHSTAEDLMITKISRTAEHYQMNAGTWKLLMAAPVPKRRRLLDAMLRAIATKRTVTEKIDGEDMVFHSAMDFGGTPATAVEWEVNERLFKTMRWCLGPFQLERPNGSRLHDFDDAVQTGKRFYHITDVHPVRSDGVHETSAYAVHDFIFQSPLFLVEHDWSAALQAPSEGEVCLPFDNMALELRISGRRVICLIAAPNQQHTRSIYTNMLVCIDFADGKKWTCVGAFDLMSSGEWVWDNTQNETKNLLYNSVDVANFIGRQLRALSIALDAKVAETAVVRAPHKLNHVREKAGKLPLRDYHVVNLANRTKTAPYERIEGEEYEKRTSPRWHYRRGHWVHYADHKTWRNWTMVGDPDLGVIDKEYRL